MSRTVSSRRTRSLGVGAALAVLLGAGTGIAVPRQLRTAPDVTTSVRTLADIAALADLAGPATAVAAGPVQPGIPEAVLAAYRRAESAMATTSPGCGLTWPVLAGIGKMESDHADGGRIDAAGNTSEAIRGPWLDGSNGTAALPASSATGTWERAVGPMQFLPATWAVYGDGGNPDNIDDAALAAGRLLCAGGSNLAESGGLAAALLRYNHSETYVAAVLAWAETYASGPVTALPGTSTLVPGATRAASAASSAAAAAAALDFATAQLGLPYVWGGDGPGNGDAGFDCSGLAHAAYVAAGISTPRTAQTQYDAGPRLLPQEPLQPGDLVFYGTPGNVHHVGLYAGDGKMINAPTFGQPVALTRYRWSGDDYVGATRPSARPGSLPRVAPSQVAARIAVHRAPAPPVRAPAPSNEIPAAPTTTSPIPRETADRTPQSTPPSTSERTSRTEPTTPTTPATPKPPAGRPNPVTPPVTPTPVPPVVVTTTSAPPRTTTAPTRTTVPHRTSAPGRPAPAGQANPILTRAEALALFASARYAGALQLVYRDATTGRLVVLVHGPE